MAGREHTWVINSNYAFSLLNANISDLNIHLHVGSVPFAHLKIWGFPLLWWKQLPMESLSYERAQSRSHPAPCGGLLIPPPSPRDTHTHTVDPNLHSLSISMAVAAASIQGGILSFQEASDCFPGSMGSSFLPQSF